VVLIGTASSALLVWALGAAEVEASRVRLVHAVPGPITVDVLLDGVPVYEGVGYREVKPYVVVPAGFHTVTARALGFELKQTVYLTGGLDTTVIGVGSGFNITVTGTVDDNRAANVNRVRLVHLSAGTPDLDLTVTGTLSVRGVEALPYKEASGYLGGLGAGVVTLTARADGAEVPLHPPTVTLEGEAIHTLFLMGPRAYLEVVPSVDQRFGGSRVLLPLLLNARGE
jgi:hypothetical protein